ncbi:formimidoylglutamase [Ginsengibacter hankyongi]|uniref:Formimidoylglutamase n=1 Tax=Ginsengibacter hankyongi TaxID=2607284 RepID=A0A5J5IKN5_9BACT|nr:formimidoylglutamase [Ginsengibacter hankyongi]KAA9039569.1 formimidoylglutamase [Ginsengibacter hankyongi]
MYDIHEFLTPINIAAINNDEGYNESQLAGFIKIYENEFPDLTGIDIVIAGINEFRGDGFIAQEDAADAVRRQLYQLYSWHKDISVADVGNIKCGATLADTFAAVKTVVGELLESGKTVILLGGSHDNTLGQYYAYRDLKKIIEATVIDATIDLKSESPARSQNFLMEMLTSEPNVIKHYNHIGFQSYFVHPRMLETMDKLRFDCYRLGKAKEQIEEMEPVIRNSDLVSFDIAAIKYSDAPSSACSPNGFTGEEACTLCRYAGLSPNLSSLGIYGYNPNNDIESFTALQIAQMIWYFIDGKNRSIRETALTDRQNFNEYHTAFAEVDTIFIQSKKTGRWWMELPNKKLIACSYNDYLFASNNEIPERWLRAQEREA